MGSEDVVEVQVVRVKVRVRSDCAACAPRYVERLALKNGKHVLVLADARVFGPLKPKAGMVFQIRIK